MSKARYAGMTAAIRQLLMRGPKTRGELRAAMPHIPPETLRRRLGDMRCSGEVMTSPDGRVCLTNQHTPRPRHDMPIDIRIAQPITIPQYRFGSSRLG